MRQKIKKIQNDAYLEAKDCPAGASPAIRLEWGNILEMIEPRKLNRADAAL
ncbi:MAG: hypothetical protein RL595_1645 [Planctomycetota bacterium]|jgi:hypothetical protein